MPDATGATDKQSTVIKADRPNWPLILAGGFLVVLCLVGVGFSRLVGSETTETSPAATAAASGGATTAASPAETAEKTTKTKSAPSETLLTAILVSGATLIIAGTLYSRISTITLPGGASIGLTNKEASTTNDTVKTELGDKTAKERQAATTEAINKVRQKKAEAGAVELAPEDIKQVVKAAVEKFK